jgi:uncharacterized membrane protein YwaF
MYYRYTRHTHIHTHTHTHTHTHIYIYSVVRLESWNLRIGKRSFARHVLVVTNYTVTMGFDGAFGDISMVTTF